MLIQMKSTLVSLLATTAVLLSLMANTVQGLYSKGSHVRQLNAKNFDRVVGLTSQPTFVKFYAPWCGHCQSLVPEYERAAKRASTQGIAKFYAVDCDKEKNRGLCAQYNVQGFPTLKVFTEKRTKRGNRRSVDYQGERKAAAMVRFVRTLLPNLSQRVGNLSKLEEFVREKSSELPKAVLLTDRKKPSDLWKGVSARLGENIAFAHIVSPDKVVQEQFGISQLPAAIVFPAPHTDIGSFEVYQGEKVSYLGLAKFIQTTAKKDRHDEL